ncbi:MAG: cytochrome c family protein [Gammaproteobacteria bacterium]|nr:cytochrome c family protein [Gammaproteobacteria bacterium]MDH3464739.1 cytochrome c family protein [Gammaproteobacteria bacterium]
MIIFNRKDKTKAGLLGTHLCKPVIIFLLVVFSFSVNTPAALGNIPDDSPSAEDERCLLCHSFERLSTTLANGEKLSLQVQEEVLAKSVHYSIGCASCHREIDLNAHMLSTNKKIYANKRERSVALSNICHECHEDKSSQYEGSIHASLVESGNLAAPVCTDCHGSHTVKPKAAYETLAGIPCKTCHENIFNVYLKSMHGQARSKLGHVGAPICSNCHRAHDVNVASVEDRLKEACVGCHEDVKHVHKKWLPNAGLHLQAVSCAACHAPAAQRRVDLLLFDSVAQRPVSENEISLRLGGLPGPEESSKDGLDAKELWNLIRTINRDGSEAEVILRGRMEVTTGEQAHQIAWKDKAIRDCESCHRDGAEPFRNVTVSLIRADGKRVSYGAEKEVLSSALSLDSAGGFYALGGTRIELLDILLLLTAVGGASVPIVHLTIRKLLRKDKSK